jgi:hypothetical protein
MKQRCIILVPALFLLSCGNPVLSPVYTKKGSLERNHQVKEFPNLSASILSYEDTWQLNLHFSTDSIVSAYEIQAIRLELVALDSNELPVDTFLFTNAFFEPYYDSAGEETHRTRKSVNAKHFIFSPGDTSLAAFKNVSFACGLGLDFAIGKTWPPFLHVNLILEYKSPGKKPQLINDTLVFELQWLDQSGGGGMGKIFCLSAPFGNFENQNPEYLVNSNRRFHLL